jgi:hypothetical protein
MDSLAHATPSCPSTAISPPVPLFSRQRASSLPHHLPLFSHCVHRGMGWLADSNEEEQCPSMHPFARVWS